jgi:cystathionine beta-lyase/cystathionine gamma-synthase
MSRSSYLKPDTVALHTGYVPESDHGSRAVPVYQTTSYVFESVSEGSSLLRTSFPVSCGVGWTATSPGHRCHGCGASSGYLPPT